MLRDWLKRGSSKGQRDLPEYPSAPPKKRTAIQPQKYQKKANEKGLERTFGSMIFRYLT